MKSGLCFLLLFCSIHLQAQEYSVNFNVNTDNPDIMKIVSVWQSYLKSNSSDYWDKDEVKALRNFNVLDMSGIINPSLMNWGLSNRILSINRISEDKFLIKSLFETDRREIFAITNVIAKKHGDSFSLSNYIFEYTKNWKNTETSNISYYYSAEYNFNNENATQAEAFYSKLCKAFDIKPEQLTYYISKNCDNIYDIIGYDYIFLKGAMAECGYFESNNNFIFATEYAGENHYHEITHVINKYYPNANELLLTGISAYISKEKAHLGKPLIYHTKRVNAYLKKHKELDLSQPSTFYKLDEFTNPQYVIGAVLCDAILEKGGRKKLIDAFRNTKTDEDLIQYFKFNILKKNEDLNTLIRKKIEKYSIENNFPNKLDSLN